MATTKLSQNSEVKRVAEPKAKICKMPWKFALTPPNGGPKRGVCVCVTNWLPSPRHRPVDVSATSPLREYYMILNGSLMFSPLKTSLNVITDVCRCIVVWKPYIEALSVLLLLPGFRRVILSRLRLLRTRVCRRTAATDSTNQTNITVVRKVTFVT